MPKKTAERRIDLPGSAGRASQYTGGVAVPASSSLADHSHDGTAGSGGPLSEAAISDLDKYTQVEVDGLLGGLGAEDLSSPGPFHHVLESAGGTLQSNLDRLDGRSMMVKTTIDAALEIPAGWQYIVHGEMTVTDVLIIGGSAVIL